MQMFRPVLRVHAESLVASTCVRFDRVIHDPLFVSRGRLYNGVQACRCARTGQRIEWRERERVKKGEEKENFRFPRFESIEFEALFIIDLDSR